MAIVSLLSRENTVGAVVTTVFKEIRDLIPFYMFLILFQFLFKIFNIIIMLTVLIIGPFNFKNIRQGQGRAKGGS